MSPKTTTPGIFDSNLQLLHKVLDLRARNQQVIAANIANAETPGYKPARLHFEEELRQAAGNSPSLPLAGTHNSHISPGSKTVADVQGEIAIENEKIEIGDENGVSVDEEMLALSENQILYEAAAQLMRKKMGMIKYVVSSGQ